MARKPETRTAAQAEPLKTEEPKVEEPKATEDVQPEEPKAAEPKVSDKLVKVYNPQRYFYVQPSTGIRIKSKTVTEVRDDNWLALQLDAKVLQRA